MKNVIIILLIAAWAWFFYDLWQNDKEIEEAKKELWITPKQNIINSDIIDNTDKEEIKKVEIIKPSYTVENLDANRFIEIDDLGLDVEKITDKIKINWKVLDSEVDKIIVKFKNKSSTYPNDTHTLDKFKKWNKTFYYNADSNIFNNIDYWVNEYIFEAYIWDEFSSISLIITIPENTWEIIWAEDSEGKLIADKVTYDKKLIGEWDNGIYIWMPESEQFWKPLNLDNWEIVYSNIDWLLIKMDKFSKSELSDSSNVWKADGSWYLNKNVWSYVYWNSFREIDFSNKDWWTSFYVLSKQDEKLVYEKYYFDFAHSLKGVLKIKEFEIQTENIWTEMSEINNKLKEENKNFEIVKLTDSLFKEIIR